MKKIKTSFANVGAYSTEENFIRGDPEGVIKWISGEAESFKEISVYWEIAKSIGFPKLEDGLSILSKDELADSLAYNSIKV